jgi:undecaprenyl-diphosphatase
MLHVGSLVAVLIVFRQRIIDMLSKDRRLILLLIIATIPGAVAGLLIKKFAPELEDSLPLISVLFIVTGILLLATLRCSEGEKTTSTMSWKDALIIGCSQAIAVMPGLSRSGTTIVTALFCRLKREEAAAFSFILSIPIIAGGGLFEGIKLMKHHGETEASVSMVPVLVGALGSCIAGILALVFLLDWLKKGKLWYFAIWVFVMSPLTMGLFFTSPVETADGRQQTAAEAEQETSEERLRFSRTAREEETVAEQTSPLDLPPNPETEEQLAAERDREFAEERARVMALIEEEHNFVPLVDEPDKLISVHQPDNIWVTPDMKSVVLTGRVIRQEDRYLEYLACRVGSHEHESILSVRVPPYFIHAALLVVNARQGKPMQTSPVFVPATGDKIDITLRWKDESGKQHECPAQDWIWDKSVSRAEAKKPMTAHWVFAGSREVRDEEGITHYLANESGELFGFAHPGRYPILDVPVANSTEDTQHQFGYFTERIPPRDTLITIILTPAR